jgi:glycosyltransferase involved in cell wall biosynthesis
VEGRTGWLVTPGDAHDLARRLIELLQDPAEARAMGIRGRHRIENSFTMSGQLDKYCRLYHDLYQHHRRRS